jgi:hypothetical protein
MAARVIEVEMGNEQRMRRVVSRSNHRVTGKYPSLKKRAMAYWESAIERDAFRRLDADLSVVAYQEQPAKIVYEIDGVRHIHYPDILVEWATHREFVEVKSDRDAASAEVVARTAVMSEILSPLGFGYRVWRESDIRVQPRLRTETYLLRHGQHPVPLVTVERLRRLFKEQPVVTWSTLINTALAPASLAIACRLILDGRLVIERDAPLSATTEVRFNSLKEAKA